MLVSNRFRNRLTDATKSRFDLVLSNQRPLVRRERNRGAVIAIQSALSDLNKGYMTPGDIDGYFGSYTSVAVESFQRDYGLVPDGIVGRETIVELDALYSSEVFREPQGMSVHIGVNEVDISHYGNRITTLNACVNDAQDFANLAETIGYQESIVLTNSEATTANFISVIRQAAHNLFSGDSLFITFSGHGSQINNISFDDEDDFKDETLVFYDRMLIDDEMFSLLSELSEGVRVTILYDSCHSGTASRMIAPDSDENTEEDIKKMLGPQFLESDDNNHDEKEYVPFDPDVRELRKALEGERAPQPMQKSINQNEIGEIVKSIEEAQKLMDDGATKSVPSFSGIYEKNQELYQSIQNVVGSQEEIQLNCTVVALSACQDNQTTLDGVVNGYFTGRVLRTWDGGNFPGSYKQFFRSLKNSSQPNITPMLNVYGKLREEARLVERPFTF